MLNGLAESLCPRSGKPSALRPQFQTDVRDGAMAVDAQTQTLPHVTASVCRLSE